MEETLYLDEKRAILATALDEAAVQGFSDGLVAVATQKAGLTAAQGVLAFPNGGVDLAAFFIREGTREMSAALAEIDMPALKIRERITRAVLVRLEIDAPHKVAATRAFDLLACPAHAGLAARLLGETADAMWRAAGDTDTDGNFYSKRAILCSIYAATRLVWLSDDSPDMQATKSFLDNRIANVMQFEKGKAQLRAWREKCPDFLSIVAKWRFRFD